jgi:glycosyltransferase involved in cell wall biosynthesis
MFLHNNIICNSEYTKESLLRSIFLYAKSRIYLIGNAHAQKNESCVGESKPPHMSPDLQPFFLTVGMINSRKAQLDVVEVFKDAERILKAKYVLIGKNAEHNPYLKKIEDFISQNNLLNRVLIWPFEKNLRSVYSAAIATIVPSINETFGRVVIESGFYGTPVIVRDIEPLSELIEHGKNGLIWDGSKAHLLELIESLLSNREYRDSLGENLRHKVLRDFSDHKYAESVKAVILGKKR